MVNKIQIIMIIFKFHKNDDVNGSWFIVFETWYTNSIGNMFRLGISIVRTGQFDMSIQEENKTYLWMYKLKLRERKLQLIERRETVLSTFSIIYFWRQNPYHVIFLKIYKSAYRYDFFYLVHTNMEMIITVYINRIIVCSTNVDKTQ